MNYTSARRPAVKEHREYLMAVEDDFYEKAFDEVQGKGLKKAIWARALSENDGDENKAKAVYIKRRVLELTAEHEIKSDNLVKGVWARAIAENGGNEKKAKAQYIEARTSALNVADDGSDKPRTAASAGRKKLDSNSNTSKPSPEKGTLAADSASESNSFAGLYDSGVILGAIFAVSFFVTFLSSEGFLRLGFDWIPIFLRSATPFLVPVYYFSKGEAMKGLQHANFNSKVSAGGLIVLFWMVGIFGCAALNYSMGAFNVSYVPSAAIMAFSMATGSKGEGSKGRKKPYETNGATHLLVDECEFVLFFGAIFVVLAAIVVLL